LELARVQLSLLAMIVSVMPAMSQSSFSAPEAASPYGGVPNTFTNINYCALDSTTSTWNVLIADVARRPRCRYTTVL